MLIWQEILTAFVLVIVLAIIFYKIMKYIRNPLKACHDCSSSCGDCSLLELKKEIESKKKK